jgi:hypothetical protein
MPCASIFYSVSRQKNFNKIRGFHKNQAVNLQTNVINVVQGFYKIIAFCGFLFSSGDYFGSKSSKYNIGPGVIFFGQSGAGFYV